MVSWITPNDLVEWQEYRQQFEKYIQNWCSKNKIAFIGTYQPIQLLKFDKIVKLTVFELVESFESLQLLDAELACSGKHLFYITDNQIDIEKSCKLANITFIPVTELTGMIKTPCTTYQEGPPLKLFDCFIQRVDSVRQSWFYFLKHYDLLDKGYVSFLLFQYPFYSDKTGLELFDYIHDHYHLGDLEHFQNAYVAMRNNVPYKNFEDTNDLFLLSNQTKYSLTLETYAVEDDHIGYCYTEKIYRALQSPNINLIFSQKNSLKKLSKLGFKIEPWLLEIDHFSWVERQQKLLDVLVNDSIDFDPKTLYNNALHNRDVIVCYKKQLLSGSYLDKILTEITET
jgi:hypothetical protein